ncbi:hypothetical protein KKC97_06595 [bacterium]|nr:hypothetical protein [bacterium]MBU1637321.1 hypothetical protein [bacterium]MBU1919255.1 hypothetical protein [bacterium]
MNGLHGSKMRRRLLGFVMLSLVACVVTAYAVDICHKHTGNGTKSDLFELGDNEDVYLKAKAPASGDLYTYIQRGGMIMVVEIYVSDGATEARKISRWDMDQGNEFGSQVNNYISGTGYAHLSTIGGTTSPCIPSGGGS